jgi:hypothetical protein
VGGEKQKAWVEFKSQAGAATKGQHKTRAAAEKKEKK